MAGSPWRTVGLGIWLADYLIGDWGQGPSSRGILHCFEKIGEYWLAIKKWITCFILYKQSFCFSFGVGEFFLKIGKNIYFFGRGMGPYICLILGQGEIYEVSFSFSLNIFILAWLWNKFWQLILITLEPASTGVIIMRNHGRDPCRVRTHDPEVARQTPYPLGNCSLILICHC